MRARTMHPYSPEIEAQMRTFYQRLSEKDRRRYAAIEALKLGHGGLGYIAEVLACDRHPIVQGLAELKDAAALAQPRIRAAGGGRKRALETIPALEETFLQVLEEHTAGSPTRADLKWTNLTQQEIAERLHAHGIEVSVTVVKQLLNKHDFRRRKAQKRRAAGANEHRDAQFARIAALKAEYLASPNPVISIDTKKKN